MAKSFDQLVARTMSKASRERATRRTRELLGEMALGELRKASGYSQKALAAKLKMRQPSLSKLENAADMQVTTLRKLVAALGGEVEIVARFPRGAVKLIQFDQGLAVVPGSPAGVRRPSRSGAPGRPRRNARSPAATKTKAA